MGGVQFLGTKRHHVQHRRRIVTWHVPDALSLAFILYGIHQG